MTYAELKAAIATAGLDLAKLSDDEAAAAMLGEFPGISGGDIAWCRVLDPDGQHPDEKLREAAAEKMDTDWVVARDAAKADGNKTIVRSDFEAAVKAGR